MVFASTLFGVSISEIIRDLGYAGLGLLMFVETVFPPIPSEAVLPLAGYFVERGELAFLLVVAVSTFGSVAGAMTLYEAARRGGRPFALRFLRFSRQDPARLDEAEEWFARRGAVIVLVGRCVPGVRSLVSLPAGALGMPRWEYLILTAIGSGLWNSALVGAGYVLGTQWDRVADVIGPVSKPLLIGAVVVAAALILRHDLRRRRAQTPAGAER